jgi:Tfp pilus assembly protein FimT
MYALLFVLVLLAIVAAWALIQHRKRRHRPRRRCADMESRIRAARASAEGRGYPGSGGL